MTNGSLPAVWPYGLKKGAPSAPKRLPTSGHRSMPPTTSTEKTRPGATSGMSRCRSLPGIDPSSTRSGQRSPRVSWGRWVSKERGVAPAAWVAIGHGTSANGNQHIHIAASLVRIDGSRVDVWQDRKTLSRACAEIEHAYGLTIVEGREGKGMPGLSRAELERTAREHLAEPPRITLARLVREASVASKDEAEFVRRLRGSGALVRPRFETGGQEAVVGYSVALRTTGGAAPIWFGGGKLAKDLTLPHLRQFWEVSKDDQRAAVVEWSAAKSVAPGREALRGHPDDWRRAVAAVERSLERLRAVPASDLGAWRGAAREAAGVFAAWSRRLEGNSPGPLAATADVLARSAQNRPGEPAPDREAVRDFRGVAAIVAQSQLSRDSPMAWATLIDQMGEDTSGHR